VLKEGIMPMMKIVLCIILFTVFTVSHSIAAEWEPIGETGRYFDKSNLSIVGKSTVSVSLKIIYDKVEIVRLDKNLRKNSEKYDFSNYSYTIVQEYMNCKDDTTAIMEVIHYNRNNKPITTSKFRDIEYIKVVSDTIGSEIYITICNYAATNIIK
jgi:hypothetical protein